MGRFQKQRISNRPSESPIIKQPERVPVASDTFVPICEAYPSHMSASPSSSPVIHSVHFYDHDDALIQRLCNITNSAIEVGNSILIVATSGHREQLVAALEQRLGELSELTLQGRLNLYDADEILEKFMVKGSPDVRRFRGSVGRLVDRSKQAAWNQDRGLTVFGEMVSILWSRGEKTAALRLEGLWNDLLNDGGFHLHCAYPRSLFTHNGDGSAMRAICESHSHVVGYAAA